MPETRTQGMGNQGVMSLLSYKSGLPLQFSDLRGQTDFKFIDGTVTTCDNIDEDITVPGCATAWLQSCPDKFYTGFAVLIVVPRECSFSLIGYY